MAWLAQSGAGDTSFVTSRRGYREGMPFQSLTGGPGNRLVDDDSHSAGTAELDPERDRIRHPRFGIGRRIAEAGRFCPKGLGQNRAGGACPTGSWAG